MTLCKERYSHKQVRKKNESKEIGKGGKKKKTQPKSIVSLNCELKFDQEKSTSVA